MARRVLGLLAGALSPGACAAASSCAASSGCPSVAAQPASWARQATIKDVEHPSAGEETANMLQRHAALAHGEPEVHGNSGRKVAADLTQAASTVHKHDPEEQEFPDAFGLAPGEHLYPPAKPTPELAKVLPLSWLHIPKSGTSMVNLFVHLPGVCPHVPMDIFVDGHFDAQGPLHWQDTFMEEYDVPGSCPGLADGAWGHQGLMTTNNTRNYSDVKGRLMIMVRQPEQRLIAAYKDIIWAIENEDRENLLAEWRSWGGLPNTSLPKPKDWARYGEGCVTKMMTREGFVCGGKVEKPTQDEVDLAKKRLHEDFSFVGLTDDWYLSMCLFHKMFKVDCFLAMFEDNRQVRPDDSLPYDPSILDGVTDPYDTQIYDEAVRIFNKRAKEFNVTEESCWDTCWRPIGLEGYLNRTKTDDVIKTKDWLKVIKTRTY